MSPLIALLLLIFWIPVVIFAHCADFTMGKCFSGGHQKSRRIKQHANQQGGIESQHTFLYMGDQIDKEKIAARLPGWREVSIDTNPKYVDLVMATGISLSDRRMFALMSNLKCRLNAKQLTDKVNFHKHMKDFAPTLIAQTYDVGPDTVLPPGVWMVRTNWGFGGSASAVATNNEEFRKLCAEFARAKVRSNNVIISEYIYSPMLYNGHKFHLRMYMLAIVCKQQATKKLYLLREGLIIPAQLPYVTTDWSNTSIHDTHGRDNKSLGIFPVDMPDGENLLTKVIAALTTVTRFLPMIDVYSESQNGYELLGADIMFTEEGAVKILEVNDGPGLTWLKATGNTCAEKKIIDFMFIAPEEVFGIPTDKSLAILLGEM